MQNFSYENEFDLDENERVKETNFHVSGFTRRLVLTQGQRTTRRWPIVRSFSGSCFCFLSRLNSGCNVTGSWQTVNHFQVIASFTTDSQKTRFANFMPSTF